MEDALKATRDQQKETWNTFSSGWRKWDAFTMNWLRPMGEEIISHLHLKPNDRVLDIAAGTGEPGLSIAGIVQPGRVMITDLSEGMLEVARDNMTRQDIRNADILVCDGCELPFADNSFDAISCRLGFMFFPDMQLAAREMFRVLKPGGRISASVWGMPDKNNWITITMSVIKKNLEQPMPPPGAPGMFRCANPGFLADLFRQVRFRRVTETELTGTLNCGNHGTYWNFMSEVVAPVVSAMGKAGDEMKEKIKKEVFDLLEKKFRGSVTSPGYGAVIVYGEK